MNAPRVTILVAISIVVIWSLNACDSAPKQTEQRGPAPTELATVNGVPYSLDSFRIFYQQRMAETKSGNTPEFQQQAFNEFMTMAVAEQEAKRHGLAAALGTGPSMELERMRALSNALLQKWAAELGGTLEDKKAIMGKRLASLRDRSLVRLNEDIVKVKK